MKRLSIHSRLLVASRLRLYVIVPVSLLCTSAAVFATCYQAFAANSCDTMRNTTRGCAVQQPGDHGQWTLTTCHDDIVTSGYIGELIQATCGGNPVSMGQVLCTYQPKKCDPNSDDPNTVCIPDGVPVSGYAADLSITGICESSDPTSPDLGPCEYEP